MLHSQKKKKKQILDFACVHNSSPSQINTRNALTLAERITRKIIYIKLVCISIYKCLVTTVTPENTMKRRVRTLYIDALQVRQREKQSHRCVGSPRTMSGAAIGHVVFPMS